MKTLPGKIQSTYLSERQVITILGGKINEIISYLFEKEEKCGCGEKYKCKVCGSKDCMGCGDACIATPLDILREKVNQLRDNKKETIAPLDEYQIVKHATLDKILSIIDELTKDTK